PLLELPEIAGLSKEAPFVERDRIKRLIAARLAQRPTEAWLKILDAADIWCAKVLNWPELMQSEGFKVLDMLQTVRRDDGVSIDTTRSPIRINGTRSLVEQGAPRIGQH